MSITGFLLSKALEENNRLRTALEEIVALHKNPEGHCETAVLIAKQALERSEPCQS